MHHVRPPWTQKKFFSDNEVDCRQYHYTLDTWKDDIAQIAAKGVDAIALNIGGDSWQMTQVASAYAAAQALNSPTKLFFSLDFTTSLSSRAWVAVQSRREADDIELFWRLSGQLGLAVAQGPDGRVFMPFIWGLEGNFGSYPSMDSWYCWGCAWPQGNYDKTTDDDNYCASLPVSHIKDTWRKILTTVRSANTDIGQLGTKYATTVSMWFFTHMSDKNRLLRSDDWLLNSRWEQLIAMRGALTFVEMVTWYVLFSGYILRLSSLFVYPFNTISFHALVCAEADHRVHRNDFGESDYFGPVRVDQPAGTTWADGYPHTAWFDMSAYYIQAFKTGVYPAITQDVIYYWARPHPHDAIVSGDGTRPDNWDWTQDYLWVAAFCSSTCTVTLEVGSSTGTFTNQPAGVNKLKIPLAAGGITVGMVKNGQTVISQTEPNYQYVLNPTKYNFNAFVGAATATGGSTTPTNAAKGLSTTTASTTTTTTTTSTSTSAAATSTPTWSYLGCYVDTTNPRTLNNGIHYSSPSDQSVKSCLAACAAAGYLYGGTEYGVECWCAAAISSGAAIAASGDCNMPCSAGGGDSCGAGNRISLYKASAVVVNPALSWSYLGCYVDSATRTLNNGINYVSSSLTIQGCQAVCADAGYAYAGLEYSQECWPQATSVIWRALVPAHKYAVAAIESRYMLQLLRPGAVRTRCIIGN
ncbi:glycosyl hydrolase family 71-domain-containing protein [Mycena leptocephala]|nr:glycosyl hydrolase family 71-domain-containing protein [Mycena leptocephala]